MCLIIVFLYCIYKPDAAFVSRFVEISWGLEWRYFSPGSTYVYFLWVPVETSNLGSPSYKFRDFRNAELQPLRESVCFHLTFVTRAQPVRMPTNRKDSPKVSSPQLALSSDPCAPSPKRVLSLFTSHHTWDWQILSHLPRSPASPDSGEFSLLVSSLMSWSSVCVCTYICIHVCVHTYVHVFVYTYVAGGSDSKNLPVMQETWVRSLSQEDPLEKEMVTHSSILAWRIPCTEEPDGLQSMGWQRVGHD